MYHLVLLQHKYVNQMKQGNHASIMQQGPKVTQNYLKINTKLV